MYGGLGGTNDDGKNAGLRLGVELEGVCSSTGPRQGSGW